MRDDLRRPPRPLDTLRLEVAEIAGGELFSWPGEKSLGDKTGQVFGVTSNSEFFSYEKAVFLGPANIKFAGTEDCLGRPCLR